MQSIYIETSVVSFLRENLLASPESVERQLITRTWWNLHRQRYELVTTQYVVDAANMGNPARAQERVRYLAGIPLVALTSKIDDLAAQIMARTILPKDADRRCPSHCFCRSEPRRLTLDVELLAHRKSHDPSTRVSYLG